MLKTVEPDPKKKKKNQRSEKMEIHTMFMN